MRNLMYKNAKNVLHGFHLALELFAAFAECGVVTTLQKMLGDRSTAEPALVAIKALCETVGERAEAFGLFGACEAVSDLLEIVHLAGFCARKVQQKHNHDVD